MKSQKTLQFKWPKFFNSKIQGKKSLRRETEILKDGKALSIFLRSKTKQLRNTISSFL